MELKSFAFFNFFFIVSALSSISYVTFSSKKEVHRTGVVLDTTKLSTCMLAVIAN